MTYLIYKINLELAMKNPSPEAYSLAAANELHRRNFQKSILCILLSFLNSPDHCLIEIIRLSSKVKIIAS